MNPIFEFFLTRKWALKPEVLNEMQNIIQRHMNNEKLSPEAIQARIGAGPRAEAGYAVMNNIAYIPVHGIISKRMSMVKDISLPVGTSIEEMQGNFLAALNDDSVSRIVLDIDSPGGSVDGVSELSELIYESRAKKQIVAFANGQMASAAYWIGSAAGKVYASKSAGLGSIGVYTVTTDQSHMEHNMGIQTTIIKAGAYKAVGHPSQPLSEDGRQVLQDEVDTIYGLFVNAVKRNRKLSDEQMGKVADGRVFIGVDAALLGLADDIVAPSAILPAGVYSGSNKQAVVQTSALDVPDKELCKKEWESDPKIRQEFRSLESYTGYRRGVAAGRIKVVTRG